MSTPRSSVQLLLLFYVCATWPCIYCSLGSASRLCWLLVDCSSACVKVTWIQINGCGLWLQPWPRWVHDTLIDMQHIMICDYCNSNCFASKFKHIFNIRCGKYTPALLGREMLSQCWGCLFPCRLVLTILPEVKGVFFCLFFMYVNTDMQNRRDKNVLGLGIKVACWFVYSSM